MAQSFFQTAVTEITLSAYGSWVDYDASSIIPAGATGVILRLQNTVSTAYTGNFRKNGSTDARTTNYLNGYGNLHVMIGVDGSRIFEAYITNANVKIYIIGYTNSGVTFLTNGVNKTPAVTGSWQDSDCSASAPDAVGLIFEGLLVTSSYVTGGARTNGSTDNFVTYAYANDWRFMITGCDVAQVCDLRTSSTGAKIYLIGYITTGFTWVTNATDVSLGTTGAYADLAAIAAGSSFGFYHTNSTTGASKYCAFRKNGNSEDLYGRSVASFHVAQCDSAGIVEGKISDIVMDFYYLGLAEGVTTSTLTVSMSALLKGLDNPLAITLDARLKGSDSKAVSLDARIAGREALTEVIDAILKGLNIPQTVAINALVRSADAKTVNLDALVKLTGSPLTTVLDALVVARTGKTVDLDLLVKALGLNTTVTVSALLRSAGAQSLTADALVSGTESKTISLTTLIKLMGIGTTVAMDAVIKGLNIPATVAIDILTRLADGKTLSLDTWISGVGAAGVTLSSLIKVADSKVVSIDALVKVLGITTTTALDVLISLADSRSVNLDAVLSGQGTATMDLNALIKALDLPEIVALDVIIGVPPFQEINIDALIAVLGIERSVALDIVIKEACSCSINLDSFVSALGVTQTVALDELLKSVDAKSVNVDFLLNSIDAKYANLDILLKSLNVNPNVLLDAMIKGTDIKHITLDVLLRSLGVSSTVLIDTLIKSSGFQSLTIDTLLKALGVSKTVLIDSLIRGSSSTTLTLDVMVRLLGIQTTVALDTILANAAILKTLSVDLILKAFSESQIALTTLVEDSDSFTVSLDAILFSPVNHRVPEARHSVGRLSPARLNPSRLDVNRR